MSAHQILVWDPLVRIFHWTLVAAFSIAYVTEDDVMWLHEAAGYTVLGLVAFRVIWGVVGTRYARFSDFVRGPAAVKQYLTTFFKPDCPRYMGHNPAGGWMVIILLVMLALTSWSGIEALEVEEGGQASNSVEIITSAHADDDDEDRDGEGNEFWEEIHEAAANITLLLVFVHIGGVLFNSLIHGENLVRAMWTGKKDQ